MHVRTWEREFPGGFPGGFPLFASKALNIMEGQTYYVYYTTTSSFSSEEKKAICDLFGRDIFSKGIYKLLFASHNSD